MPVKNRIRCSVIFIIAQFLATVGWAEVYRIGINDTLNIQITVWDAGKTEVVARPLMPQSVWSVMRRSMSMETYNSPAFMNTRPALLCKRP